MMVTAVASRSRSIIMVARFGYHPRPPPLTSSAHRLSCAHHNHHRFAASSSTDATPTDVKSTLEKSRAGSSATDGSSSYYGMSNFRMLLHHQSQPAAPIISKRKKKQRQRQHEKMDIASQGKEQSHRETQGYAKVFGNEGGREVANSSQHHQDREGNSPNTNQGQEHEDMKTKKQHWRSSNGHRSKQPHTSMPTADNPAIDAPRIGSTSEWILISNVPPMSELTDVMPSLRRILEYELRKGILDLDRIDDLMMRKNWRERDDHGKMNTLKQIGAFETMYSTRNILPKSNLPLWTPSCDEGDPISSMVLEARVHLSYRARPMGWFLRLPSRSVVHAIINHVQYAQDINWSTHKGNKSNIDNNTLRQKRRRWREGLWMGVYEEYQMESKVEAKRDVLESETSDEIDVKFGGFGGEKGVDGNGNAPSTSAVCRNDEESEMESLQTQHQDEKEHQGGDDVESYLNGYFESNPYPAYDPPSATTEYHLLKSGSSRVDVQEFLPNPQQNEQPTWEQHSFRLGPLLNLSDSTVRIETSALKTSVDDIKYMFRFYDMDGVTYMSPEEAEKEREMTSHFTSLPESLGWNVHDSVRNNVGCLVEGTFDPHVLSHHTLKGSKVLPKRAKRHTFLVRFATPADARMAVRDKQGTPLHYANLTVTQYPRQWG